MYQRILTLQQATPPADASQIRKSRDALISYLTEMGELAAVEDLQIQVLQLEKAKYGAGDSRLLGTLDAITLLQYDQQAWDRLISHSELALRIAAHLGGGTLLLAEEASETRFKSLSESGALGQDRVIER